LENRPTANDGQFRQCPRRALNPVFFEEVSACRLAAQSSNHVVFLYYYAPEMAGR
jgi:hypothetical protein